MGRSAETGRVTELDSSDYYPQSAPYEVRVNREQGCFLPIGVHRNATGVLDIHWWESLEEEEPNLRDLRIEFGGGNRGFAERR